MRFGVRAGEANDSCDCAERWDGHMPNRHRVRWRLRQNHRRGQAADAAGINTGLTAVVAGGGPVVRPRGKPRSPDRQRRCSTFG
jgi:hypothetical protein